MNVNKFSVNNFNSVFIKNIAVDNENTIKVLKSVKENLVNLSFLQIQPLISEIKDLCQRSLKLSVGHSEAQRIRSKCIQILVVSGLMSLNTKTECEDITQLLELVYKPLHEQTIREKTDLLNLFNKLQFPDLAKTYRDAIANDILEPTYSLANFESDFPEMIRCAINDDLFFNRLAIVFLQRFMHGYCIGEKLCRVLNSFTTLMRPEQVKLFAILEPCLKRVFISDKGETQEQRKEGIKKLVDSFESISLGKDFDGESSEVKLAVLRCQLFSQFNLFSKTETDDKKYIEKMRDFSKKISESYAISNPILARVAKFNFFSLDKSNKEELGKFLDELRHGNTLFDKRLLMFLANSDELEKELFKYGFPGDIVTKINRLYSDLDYLSALKEFENLNRISEFTDKMITQKIITLLSLAEYQIAWEYYVENRNSRIYSWYPICPSIFYFLNNQYVELIGYINKVSIKTDYTNILLFIAEMKTNKIDKGEKEKQELKNKVNALAKLPKGSQIPFLNALILQFVVGLEISFQYQSDLKLPKNIDTLFIYSKHSNTANFKKQMEFVDEFKMNPDYFKIHTKNSKNPKFQFFLNAKEPAVKFLPYNDTQFSIALVRDTIEKSFTLDSLEKSYLGKIFDGIKTNQWLDDPLAIFSELTIQPFCTIIFTFLVEKYLKPARYNKDAKTCFDDIVCNFVTENFEADLVSQFEKFLKLLQMNETSKDDISLFRIIVQILKSPKNEKVTRLYDPQCQPKKASYEDFRKIYSAYTTLMKYFIRQINGKEKEFERSKTYYSQFLTKKSKYDPINLFSLKSYDLIESLNDISKRSNVALSIIGDKLLDNIDLSELVTNQLNATLWRYEHQAFRLIHKAALLTFLDSNSKPYQAFQSAYDLIDAFENVFVTEAICDELKDPIDMAKAMAMILKSLKQCMDNLKEHIPKNKPNTRLNACSTIDNKAYKEVMLRLNYFSRHLLNLTAVRMSLDESRKGLYIEIVLQGIEQLQKYFDIEFKTKQTDYLKYSKLENPLNHFVRDVLKETKAHFKKQISLPLSFVTGNIDIIKVSGHIDSLENDNRILRLLRVLNRYMDILDNPLKKMLGLCREEKKSQDFDVEWIIDNDIVSLEPIQKKKGRKKFSPRTSETKENKIEKSESISIAKSEISQENKQELTDLELVEILTSLSQPRVRKTIYPDISFFNTVLQIQEKNSRLKWISPENSIKSLSSADTESLLKLDECYHREHAAMVLDLISEIKIEDRVKYPFLFTLLVNHIYLNVEQNLTEQFFQQEDTPFFHGLTEMANFLNSKESWNEIDKYTLWYRYPHSKFRSMDEKKQEIPEGMKLIMSLDGDLSGMVKKFPLLEKVNLLSNPFVQLENILLKAVDFWDLGEMKEPILKKIESMDLKNTSLVNQKTLSVQQSNGFSACFDVLNKIKQHKFENSQLSDALFDLSVHLKRLKQSYELFNAFNKKKYSSLHNRNVFIAMQYCWETLGKAFALLEGAEVQTHSLGVYRIYLRKNELYNQDLHDLFTRINLLKGGDYPYRVSVTMTKKIRETKDKIIKMKDQLKQDLPPAEALSKLKIMEGKQLEFPAGLSKISHAYDLSRSAIIDGEGFSVIKGNRTKEMIKETDISQNVKKHFELFEKALIKFEEQLKAPKEIDSLKQS